MVIDGKTTSAWEAPEHIKWKKECSVFLMNFSMNSPRNQTNSPARINQLLTLVETIDKSAFVRACSVSYS